MMLARVCRAGISPQVTSFLKSPVVQPPRLQVARLFASDGRSTFTRTVRKRTGIVEESLAPAGETAFNVGKAAIAGASGTALGALCYYGFATSGADSAIEHSQLWPEYVKERVRSTYLYFGGSILGSALTAAACLRSPAVMRIVTRQGMMSLVVSLVAMVGSGMIARSIPYEKGFGAKQVAWLAHTAVIGTVLAPLSLFGGPLIIRAALYTAGVVGGLSAIAICAPSEKFLNMSGPLGIGLGVVFVSSLGSVFLPPTTVLGSGLHSMALYGGLVLFSMFLLYDTQKIIHKAETHPNYYAGREIRPYDPVNGAMSIYMDTINIFVRILQIVSGGGGNRK